MARETFTFGEEPHKQTRNKGKETYTFIDLDLVNPLGPDKLAEKAREAHGLPSIDTIGGNGRKYLDRVNRTPRYPNSDDNIGAGEIGKLFSEPD